MLVACSRRSDSREREKNSRRKKNRGKTRGGKEEKTRSRPPPPPPPPPFSRCTPHPPPPPPPFRFPGVQLNSLPHLSPRSTIWTPGTGYKAEDQASSVELLDDLCSTYHLFELELLRTNFGLFSVWFYSPSISLIFRRTFSIGASKVLLPEMDWTIRKPH